MFKAALTSLNGWASVEVMPFCANCGSQSDGRYCPNCGYDTALGQPASSPPPVASASPPSARRSPLLYILIGCFGLLVLGALGTAITGWFLAKKVREVAENPAVAVAKILAAANPDIDVLEVDDDAGFIRIREKSTGKEMTIDFEEARQGRIVMRDESGRRVELRREGGRLEVETPEGRLRVGGEGERDLPAWLPTYTGTTGQALLSSTEQEGRRGVYTFQTPDDANLVAAFYEAELPKAGFEVKRESVSAAAGTTISLAASSSDKLTRVKILRADGNTVVAISWEPR